MPIVKSRNTKRPSSSGYSSTVTTIIFVALCVLGVWMLSSDTVAPLKSTTRTAGTTSIDSSSSSSLNAPEENAAPDKNKQPVFTDSEGDLPEDAIKPDNEASRDDRKDEASSEVPNDPAEVVTTSDNANEVVSESNDKQDSGQQSGVPEENGDKPDSGPQNGVPEENGDGKHEEEQDSGGAGAEDEKVDSGKGSEMSQIADESSSGPQNNQEPEEETKENQGKDSGGSESQKNQDGSDSPNVEGTTDHEDSGGRESQQSGDNSHTQQSVDNNQIEEEGNKEKNDRVISDEDQQKRVEQHQKQEDDQMQQGQAQKETQEATKDNGENQKVSNQDMDQKEKASKSQNNDSFDSTVIPKESKDSKKSWATQADQSENEKERRKVGTEDQKSSTYGYHWQLCNVTSGADYIPCLDNEKAIAKLRSRKHFEHRERHCPEEPPTCLVPPPEGYKKSIEWPHSRDKIWYNNVPHALLAEFKGHQNWVKVTGEFLTFPGGGTQFIHGALHYIDFIQKAVPDIAWGKHSRVVLDVGCGVASFGGFLFDRDVLTMSFAPKDEHEAQVQFALERGIPAISAVMGSQRLPFPSKVFDIVHCARCRVPWHAEGGALLLELNRVLRPGGYFVWSATPVYRKLEEDVKIWNEMTKLTVSMCWELVTIKKDKLNSIGAAIYHKPDSNECYDKRKQDHPPMCNSDDDPNASWYVPLQACMHRVPIEENVRGSEWPTEWPRRLQTPPYWLNRSQMGIYGKPAPEDFTADYEHWKQVVSKTYLSGLGISWSNVRNIMDMRAVYGGFAAALKDLKVWVMNVVNVDSPDTLPIIYERGLFGIYHDWCESFSTYPRTYDLLHADRLFSRLKKRCKLVPVMAEVDRITRPGGKLIVRDGSSTIEEVENLLKSLHWEVHMTTSKHQEGILSAQKSNWRPDSYAAPS